MQELLNFTETTARDAPDMATLQIIKAADALSEDCYVTATVERQAPSSGTIIVYAKDEASPYRTPDGLHVLVDDEATGQLPNTCAIVEEEENCAFLSYHGPIEQMAEFMQLVRSRILVARQAELAVASSTMFTLPHAS